MLTFEVGKREGCYGGEVEDRCKGEMEEFGRHSAGIKELKAFYMWESGKR